MTRHQLIIVLALFVGPAHSQGIVEKISYTVGLLSFESKVRGSVTGTGTLIGKIFPNNGLKVFIVTNKHVLPEMGESDSIFFTFRNVKLNPYPILRIPIPVYVNGQVNEIIKFDPDGNDLAAINVTELFIKFKELSYLGEIMFTDSFLANRDSVATYDVELGDEVFFIGYPNFIYNRKNFSPLVRTGIIASSPFEDFYLSSQYITHYFLKTKTFLPVKLNGFLIDANAFGGSSGSIVFTKPKLIKVVDGQMKYNPQPEHSILILGVLTFSYFDLSNGERVQLGGVVSSSQIKKTIDSFDRN